MTDVVTVVRQSQGTDDSVSLELQREKTLELAADLGDEDPELVDLGVRTGFSIFMHGNHTGERIDADERMLTLLDDLVDSEYDHLVAWDDTRLSRDQFYWVLKWHAIQGDTELHFVKDQPEDDLTFRVQRAVESEVKMKEIEKTKEAMQHREDQGFDHGRPRFGMQYDDDGRRQVPGERFDEVREIFRRRSDGESFRAIAGQVSASHTTVMAVCERREWYEERSTGGLV